MANASVLSFPLNVLDRVDCGDATQTMATIEAAIYIDGMMKRSTPNNVVLMHPEQAHCLLACDSVVIVDGELGTLWNNTFASGDCDELFDRLERPFEVAFACAPDVPESLRNKTVTCMAMSDDFVARHNVASDDVRMARYSG